MSYNVMKVVKLRVDEKEETDDELSLFDLIFLSVSAVIIIVIIFYRRIDRKNVSE